MEQLCFGIISTGNIATQFVEGINGGSTRCTVTAVASRSAETAKAFAEKYGIPGAHGSYDDLLTDPDVDAVYNALPNLYHKEWTLKALAAGKHVLCEKPMGMDADETQAMFDAAKAADRTLIEAFMYRTHPQTKAVVQKIREGAIGEVKLIRTTFCYRTEKIQGNTRFDQSLGGGATMDIGCYCVDFARQITGEDPAFSVPEAIQATGRLVESTDGGMIDVSASGVLTYPSGIVSTFSCAMDTQASNLAQVCGTAGYIEVPVPWKPGIAEPTWMLRTMTKPRQDGVPDEVGEQLETFTTGVDKPLYALEADAFAETVLDGAEPFMSPEESIGNAKVLEALLERVGVQW
ncbi:MAG: Gfo/Idh/MocA family oxidoreductase [Phycisphaeraceae bacterium]|nr:Gfo/Idh/MocA family oxidoreductase [Phycisphaeraceae bacterium]